MHITDEMKKAFDKVKAVKTLLERNYLHRYGIKMIDFDQDLFKIHFEENKRNDYIQLLSEIKKDANPFDVAFVRTDL